MSSPNGASQEAYNDLLSVLVFERTRRGVSVAASNVATPPPQRLHQVVVDRDSDEAPSAKQPPMSKVPLYVTLLTSLWESNADHASNWQNLKNDIRLLLSSCATDGEMDSVYRFLQQHCPSRSVRSELVRERFCRALQQRNAWSLLEAMLACDDDLPVGFRHGTAVHFDEKSVPPQVVDIGPQECSRVALSTLSSSLTLFGENWLRRLSSPQSTLSDNIGLQGFSVAGEFANMAVFAKSIKNGIQLALWREMAMGCTTRRILLPPRNTYWCAVGGGRLHVICVSESQRFTCAALAVCDMATVVAAADELILSTSDFRDLVCSSSYSETPQPRGLLFHGGTIQLGRFALKQHNDPFTVELWMFPCSAEEHQTLFSHGDKSQEEVLLEVFPSEGGIVIRGGCRSPQVGSHFVTCETAGMSLLARWTHVALTFSGVCWKLFVNGELLGQSRSSRVAACGVPESPCTIGKNFVGHLAQLRVWSEARSQTDILRDMRRELLGSERRLVGYFPVVGDSVVLWDRSVKRAHAVVAFDSSVTATVQLPDLPYATQAESHEERPDVLPSLLSKRLGGGEVSCAASGNLVALAFSSESRCVILEYRVESLMQVRRTKFSTSVSSIAYVTETTLLCLGTGTSNSEGKSFGLWALPPLATEWYLCGAWPSAWHCGAAFLQQLARRLPCIVSEPQLPSSGGSEPTLSVDLIPSLLKLAHRGSTSVESNREGLVVVESCTSILAHLFANSRRTIPQLFTSLESDVSKLLGSLDRPVDPTNLRDLLQWLAFKSSSGALLSQALGHLLTEKCIFHVLSKFAGRARASELETRLLHASLQYLTTSICLRDLTSKPERLGQLHASLLAEGSFELQQCLLTQSAQQYNGSLDDLRRERSVVKHVLHRVHSLLSSTAGSGTTAGGVAVGVSASCYKESLRTVEKAFVLMVQQLRKGGAATPTATLTIASNSFVSDILQHFARDVVQWPNVIQAQLVGPTTACREALNTLLQHPGCANHGWLKQQHSLLVSTCATLLTALVAASESSSGGGEVTILGHPFTALFRCGYVKPGSVRDAFAKNLQQGVGSVSRLLHEIQMEDMPLRSGDVTLWQLERVLTACFGTALLESQSIASPTKEVLWGIYRHVKALRTWVLSQRQLDGGSMERIEKRAALLCKFEPCGITRSFQPPVAEQAAFANAQAGKKWRRMFQAWKAMRNLKSLMFLSASTTCDSLTETVSTIVSFLQSSTPTTQEIDRFVRTRSLKAQCRLQGYSGLKVLLDEGQTCPAVDELLQQAYCRAMCGLHYAAGVDGVPGETLARLRASHFILLEELVSRIERHRSDALAEMLLSTVVAPWRPTDFSKMPLNVVSILATLAGAGSADPQFLQRAVVNHAIPSGQHVAHSLLLLPSNCGGTIVAGRETRTLRGTGSRGAFISPVAWRVTDAGVKYFELTVIELAPSATIGVGLGPATFNVSRPPGWEVHSYALHSDDGMLFAESSNGRQTSFSFGVGDTVGCGWNDAGDIYWTRNGKLLNVSIPSPCEVLCPLVGIDGRGIVKLNFGESSMEFVSPRYPPGSPVVHRPLHDRSFDVLRLLAMSAAQASQARDADTDSMASAIRCVTAFITCCTQFLRHEHPSVAFLTAVCAGVTTVCAAIGSAPQVPTKEGDLLCQALMKLAGGRQLALCCSALDALGSCYAVASPEVQRAVIALLLDASHVEHALQVQFLWTNDVHWAAITVLRRMASGFRTAADELLRCLDEASAERVDDKRRVTQLLEVFGGAPLLPHRGDTVWVLVNGHERRRASLVRYSIADEVCEVAMPGTPEPRTVPLTKVTNTAASPVVPLSQESAAKLLNTALQLCRRWSSTSFDSDSARVLMRALRLLKEGCSRDEAGDSSVFAVAEEERHLLLQTVLPLCFVSVRPSGRSLASVELEELCLHAVLLSRPTEEPQTSAAQAAATVETSGASAERHAVSESSIDETRARMAQELSMRGFSLEMCVIALEETHYDRSAALRLLADHHEDLLHVLHQEEEGDLSEGESNDDEDDPELQNPSDDDDSHEQDSSDSSCSTGSSERSQIPGTHEAVQFDGSSAIRCSAEVGIGSQFTLDFWVRLRDIGERQFVITQRAATNEGVMLFVLVESHSLRFGWGPIDGGDPIAACSMELLPTDVGKWLRITCVQDSAKDSATIALFKNTNLKDDAELPVVEALLSNELWIGGAPELSFPTAGLRGDVKNIRVYDMAITDDIAGGAFSLSQAPTSPAIKAHLVFHFRCDDGQFPLENVAVGPSSLTVLTAMVGNVVWLGVDTEQQAESNTGAMQEVDFTTHDDYDDLPLIDIETLSENAIAWNRHYKTLTTAELREVQNKVTQDLVAHYTHRIVLSLLARDVQLVGMLQPAHAKSLVSFAIQCSDDDVRRSLETILCHPNVSDGFLSASVSGGLLQAIQVPQRVCSFESPHPCKSFGEAPREVSTAVQPQYSVFMDQRCSTSSMLLTVYSDAALSSVAAQYSSTALSSFRVKSQRLLFDVRLDGVGSQWGYKLYIVFDDVVQLRAARILRACVLHHIAPHRTLLGASPAGTVTAAPPVSSTLSSLFASAATVEALCNGVQCNTGKIRRLLLASLSDLLRIARLPNNISWDSLRMFDLRKMAERQYRREVGLHSHSKFVQSCTEYFIALKDAEAANQPNPDAARNGFALHDAVEQDSRSRFVMLRTEQKKRYASKLRQGRNRVGVERVAFPDHIRIEQNSDKTTSVWSVRSGSSVMADVALNAGRWYFEVRMAASGDVAIGVTSGAIDRVSFSSTAASGPAFVGFNGRTTTTATGPTTATEGSKSSWKAKDVVGVMIDLGTKTIQFTVNGQQLSTVVPFESPSSEGRRGAAAAASSRATTTDSSESSGEDDEEAENCGVFPYFCFGADEGITVNFGVTHFEFDIPRDALPLDPSHLSLGTLIPFNQVRALEDVSAALCEGSMSLLPPFFVDEVDPFENPSFRRGPPHVSLVAVAEKRDVVINLMEAKNNDTCFATVRGDCAVYAGRWYYEVTLVTQGLMQIGWLPTTSAAAAAGAAAAEATVGDVATSWGFDGFRRQKWVCGESSPVNITRRWISGDVVGCALDIAQRRVTFYLNGRQVAESYMDLRPPLHDAVVGFHPAASLRPGNAVTFNFGSTHMRFKPEAFAALGVPDTWQERMDTYYASLSTGACAQRRERARQLLLMADGLASLSQKRLPYERRLVVDIDTVAKRTARSCMQLSVQALLKDSGSSLLGGNTEDGTASTAAAVAAVSPEKLQRSFEFLKDFSRIAQSALPLLRICRREDNFGLRCLVALRPFLFAATRESFVSSLLKETNCRSEHLRLNINRRKALKLGEPGEKKTTADETTPWEDTVFGQTYLLLRDQSPRHFKTSKRMWSVLFLGEGAEDVGGPYREHLGEMCRELMSATLSLFIRTPNHVNNVGTFRDAFTPNPTATLQHQLGMFEFLGRVMGGAMRSGEPLNLLLPPLFWKLLLKEDVREDDLDSLDRMCLNCIREMNAMVEQYGEDGRELFDETFETEHFVTQLSGGSVVPLMEGGANVPLRFDRCAEYTSLLAHVRLHESEVQISRIRDGLLSVVPELALSLLTAKELELRICGNADYTVQELKECTSYEGLTSEDRRVQFLWQCLEEATATQRRLFLRFVSGRERMPVELRVLPMASSGDPNRVLPRAATCFFAVELPDYTSAEVLKERLFYAIENCLDIDTDFRARDVEDDEGPQLMVGVESRQEDPASDGASVPE